MRTPEKGERWGILGGAFDPVHLGHINLAGQIHDIKKLNGVLLVPTWTHPVKNSRVFASFDDRLEMLKLAVKDFNYFCISSLEKEEQLSGYTLDTIRAIKKRYPQVEFYFIIGSDNINQLDKWYHPEEILQEIKILAGTRPTGITKAIDSVYSKRIEFIDIKPFEASSSDIRTLLKEKKGPEAVKPYLNEKVAGYIFKKELYK